MMLSSDANGVCVAGRRRTSPGIWITHNSLPDRRARQYGLARFHPVDMVERIPGRTNIRRSRMRLVMTHEIADQRLGHAKLHVAVDMRIGRIVDLRDQDLEPRLEDQRM